jgi:phospholipid/cholesterol/gamma-HCH transport system substrate-binding protein
MRPLPGWLPRSLPRWRWRRGVVALLAPALLLALSGCRGAYDLPLPGGVAGHGDVYRVTVQMDDVLDLVPQSAVKVGDVTVGSVESISLKGWTAQVVVRLKRSVRLPDNATAQLQQTSLLGEKYVSLQAPSDAAPVGRLSDGDVIPVSRTGRDTDVEEVLGALSMLLNGGGVGQLKIIETELNKALGGNESAVRDLLSKLDVLIGQLDSQKSEINRAITSIDKLAARLATQKQDIATALDDLPGGLKVLADQRKQLTGLLTALSHLGTVGSRVIRASRADTVANLQDLRPVLTALDDAGDALPASLQLLLTYPFPDSAVDGVKGDYTNLWVTADLDARSLLQLGSSPAGPLPKLPVPSLPTLPTLPTLPALPSLPGVPTVTCTILGQKVTLPGTTCPPAIGPGDTTVTCAYDALPALRLPFKGSTCPKGWTKVAAPSGGSGSGSGSGGGSGGGAGSGICLPGVLCLGSAAGDAEQPGSRQDLTGLLLGGAG